MSEALMSNSLIADKISEYESWRTSLIKTITNYRDWLATSPHSDSVQELRLYDMLEMLGRDQIVVAFLAEFSRGKSETISALFFSDFNQRLLPSEPGLSSMCTSEIFWDARAEPSITLLRMSQNHRRSFRIVNQTSQHTCSGADLARAAALPLLCQFDLNLVPQLFSNDGFMLAFEGLTLMHGHAAIDAIGQKVIKITALEVDPASRPAIFALLYFGMAVVLGQFVDQFRN